MRGPLASWKCNLCDGVGVPCHDLSYRVRELAIASSLTTLSRDTDDTCPSVVSMRRAYGEIAESGRPLAGRSQGQYRTVAKLLRWYAATTYATVLSADALTAPVFSLCRL